MDISINPIPTIYRNLYENTDPNQDTGRCMLYLTENTNKDLARILGAVYLTENTKCSPIVDVMLATVAHGGSILQQNWGKVFDWLGW